MLTPHQKIMKAAKLKKGLRLSADEVYELSRDDAISACAENDSNPDVLDQEWNSFMEWKNCYDTELLKKRS